MSTTALGIGIAWTPVILVLDEATSALDTQTERLVQELLAAGARYALLVARDENVEPGSQGAVAGIA